MPANFQFEVKKDDLEMARLLDFNEAPKLAKGEALLKVERFAFTANTITYGVAGDSFGYWKFFPSTEDDWGRLPVWGIGEVVDSNGTDLDNGARYYGYFSISSHLKVAPARVSGRGFVDASVHRAELPILYNQYSRLASEHGFPPKFDNHQIVYRPLFMTCFVIDDFLAENDYFGAKTIISTSASSKTAIGSAYLMKRNRDIRHIGLTSPGNVDFVRNLDLYNEVVSYSELESLNASEPVMVVDYAGSHPIVRDLRLHFQDNLFYFCGVGHTHWDVDAVAGLSKLPGAPFKQFFAPTQIQKRTKDWGKERFKTLLNEAWTAFAGDVTNWIDFQFLEAPADIESQYERLAKGPNPAQALVFEMK